STRGAARSASPSQFPPRPSVPAAIDPCHLSVPPTCRGRLRYAGAVTSRDGPDPSAGEGDTPATPSTAPDGASQLGTFASALRVLAATPPDDGPVDVDVNGDGDVDAPSTHATPWRTSLASLLFPRARLPPENVQRPRARLRVSPGLLQIEQAHHLGPL